MAQQDTQRIIVSQSMLKLIMEYSKQINKPLKLKEMVSISNVLVDYCINGKTKEITDTLEKVDVYIKKLFENEG